MLGWGFAQNTQILFRAEDIVQKPAFLSFLAITIAVRQTELLYILIPLQNEHVGMGICVKHTNFIQSERYCSKTFIFFVFGYNNCSASNWSILNTHTSSKWACWDGDMRKTQILFRAKDISQKPSFLSFLAITIAVRQTEVLLTLSRIWSILVRWRPRLLDFNFSPSVYIDQKTTQKYIQLIRHMICTSRIWMHL